MTITARKIKFEEPCEQNIEATPQYRIARDTVRLLAELYEVKVKVVFHNRQTSCCTGYNRCTPTIIFGYNSLTRAYDYTTFNEYDCCKWIIEDVEPTSENNVKLEACHEFAHALVMARGDYYNEHRIHTAAAFQKAYREIVKFVF